MLELNKIYCEDCLVGMKQIDDKSNEGDLVLDNAIGCGTTALACIETKRNYIGFDINQEYVDLANNRISRYNG